MRSRTRVGTSIDVQRLGQAIARPGLDTRLWVSLAVALDESFMDPNHGPFVDVYLMPSQQEVTARIPAAYAGNGFGTSEGTIHKDDELLVIAPSGDPNEGCVVTCRLWSAADLPPQQAIDNPDDVVTVLEEDKSYYVAVQGSGDIEMVADTGDAKLLSASGMTFLGDDGVTTEGPTADGVVVGSGIDPFTGQTYTTLQNASTVVFAKKGPL